MSIAAATLLSASILGARASSDLEDRIAQIVARNRADLTRPLERGELATEKGRRAREAIRKGDFKLARQIIGDVLAASSVKGWRFQPFGDFIGAVPDPVDPTFLTRLDEWNAQAPGDAIPPLVRAEYFARLGWFIRGDNYTKYILPEHMAAAERAFAKGNDDIAQSIMRDDSNPYTFVLALGLARTSAQFDNMAAIFEAGRKKHPDYYKLYDATLAMLQPKWGGSVEAMREFVDLYAGKAPDDSPLKMLYLSYYRHLLNAASLSCYAAPRQSDGRSECVDAMVKKGSGPTLEKELLAAMGLYGKSDRYEFGLAVFEPVSDMLGNHNADRQSGALLQMLASTMGADTKLEPSGSGSGAYVIDLLVAKSWSDKRFADNAVKKAEQARAAIDRSPDLSSEQKGAALGQVYGFLALLTTKSGDYAQAIAYQKLAKLYGDNTKNDFRSCYAYFSLKAFQAAVADCSNAIADNPSNINSRFWRGLARKELADNEGAIADLELVAGSENNFRATAAIDLSMMAFARKDLPGALNVLERYTFLYNPELVDRTNVAVAYNNLCYAQMELKAFDKALEACTQSLRYGNLPDAYRKQQELVRLTAR